jgi:hypothetical protein
MEGGRRRRGAAALAGEQWGAAMLAGAQW